MGNPEPNPLFQEQTGVQKAKKGDRCRDSMEAVLTNEMELTALFFLVKKKESKMNASIEYRISKLHKGCRIRVYRLCIRSEKLTQKSQPNPYFFFMKKKRIVMNRF